MVNEVGLRLGYQPPQRVEDALTLPQIRLQWQWLNRAHGRAEKRRQWTIVRGGAHVMTGKPVDD